MGKLVAQQALDAGHDVGEKITSQQADLKPEALADLLRGHDVAIDFSVAPAVARNVTAAAQAGVPIVVGTTGWDEERAAVSQAVVAHDGALVYGANFSIGVNLFYRVVAFAAQTFAAAEDYAPFIEEAHHARKRDAPSGTALRLAELMKTEQQKEIPIFSTRAGSIPGTHRVGFDALPDQITLTHTARSRAGFAAGALLAAQWIVSHKGVHEFSEVIDEIAEF